MTDHTKPLSYVNKNILIVITCLLLSISITLLLLLNYTEKDFSASRLEKLSNVNTNFKNKIDDHIDSAFSSIKLISKISNARVALTYDMTHQFFISVKDIVNTDNLALIDKDGAVISSWGKGKHELKESLPKLIDQTKLDSKSLFIAKERAIYIQKIFSKDNSLLGYISGSIDFQSLQSYLSAKYYMAASSFLDLKPSIILNSDSSDISNNNLIITFTKGKDNTIFHILNWRSIAVIILVGLITVIISTILIQRNLSQPFTELKTIIKFLSTPNNSNYHGKLPNDPVFRTIAQELLSMHNKRSKLEQTIIEKKKYEAIANTVQMLAHDVRKPFTMLQGTLDIINSNVDKSEVKSFIIKAIPYINNAIFTVNGMIQDIMEAGSVSQLHQEPSSLKSIINNNLIESLRFNNKANITIEYNFTHNSQLYVDTTKVNRVFYNIINNAVQAMRNNGKLSFYSIEMPDYIEVSIHNSGSYIPKSEHCQLFEAFYTKGKKDGTGLGLAIAKKVVNAHGGKIKCKSSQLEGTTFMFTLPTYKNAMDFNLDLPESSQTIQNSANFLQLKNDPTKAFANEFKDEQKIIKAGKRIKFLICDDEALYRNIIKNMILREQNIADLIDITLVSSGENAIKKTEKASYDVILMDIDLGKNTLNGFETVEAIRKNDTTALIYIHSNRGVNELGYKAESSKAQGFLPKPITRTHLLNILKRAISVDEVTVRA